MGRTGRGKMSAMMQRGVVFSAECPSRVILNHVTSRWGVLVLVALRGGTHRFSELRRKIGGVSEKMLAQTLQQPEQDGFIDRVGVASGGAAACGVFADCTGRGNPRSGGIVDRVDRDQS